LAQNVGYETARSRTSPSYYEEIFQINDGGMNKFVAYNGNSRVWRWAIIPATSCRCTNTSRTRGRRDVVRPLLPRGVRRLVPESHHAHRGQPPCILGAGEDVQRRRCGDGTIRASNAMTTRRGDYVVNTSFSVNQPHRTAWIRDPDSQSDNPTIGDQLTDANVKWAWYAADGTMSFRRRRTPVRLRQLSIPSPAVPYFAKFADDQQENRKEHLKDEVDFVRTPWRAPSARVLREAVWRLQTSTRNTRRSSAARARHRPDQQRDNAPTGRTPPSSSLTTRTAASSITWRPQGRPVGSGHARAGHRDFAFAKEAWTRRRMTPQRFSSSSRSATICRRSSRAWMLKRISHGCARSDSAVITVSGSKESRSPGSRHVGEPRMHLGSVRGHHCLSGRCIGRA